ncbi:sugar transferase, partial [Muricomes intestini]|uniref:sugar transferase n=1 Tax=Muricomes intestini TaxID=1796634 RepID=UPI002FE3DDC8
EDAIEGLLQPYRNYQLNACALYDTADKVGTEIKYVPVVADKEHIIGYIQDNIVDEVFIDLPGYEEEAERLMGILVSMGLVAHINLARFTPTVENKMIHQLAGFMVLSSGIKFASSRQLFFKRFIDILGGIVGLLATGIAFIIFAPIIKRQSPGPVFFAQERVGRNGRRFKIYKFRTMYPDAEKRKKELMAQNKMDGFMFKMDNDPRIIPIGHFLRKSSIDEFPQFWNVLKGNMSLVGTRPPTVDEYEKYELRHRKRLAMRPGLTGMWQ